MNRLALPARLAASLRPVRRISRAQINFEWMAVTLASFLIIGLIYGFRPDLALQLSRPLFGAEIALNILLIGIAGFSAAALAYPDQPAMALLKPLLALVFAGYSGLMFVTALQTPAILGSMANTAPHGLECLLCILSFASIPAAWMLWRLRGLASTQPMLTGLAALLMATATGNLGVRLVEREIVSAGLLLWHYLPLLGFSGAGLLAGRKIFRW